MQQHRGCNIYNIFKTNNSQKLRTALIATAVIASAMTMLFVLHTVADNSSAETIIDTGSCGPDARFDYCSGTLRISGSGEMYDYVNGTAPWYDYREDITKIIVGEDISKLGQWAFLKCTNVGELIIPITLDSVACDQYSAFAGCCNLEKVIFTFGTDGNGFDYSVSDDTGSLYRLTPWYQSRAVLQEIYFENGIRHIGDHSFRELGIHSLTIPDSVVSLGKGAFIGCTGLNQLTIPITLDSVVSAQYSVFTNCSDVKQVVFTPGNGGYGHDYSASIYSDSWYQNTPWYQSRAVLTKIILDDGVTHIGNDAFRELNITSIVIPDTVCSLGNHCFYNCTKITDLTIPVSLNSYGNEDYPAFRGCMAIYKVVITRGNGVPFDYHDFWGIKNSDLTPWNMNTNYTQKTVIISDDVNDLGDFMFYKTDIKELTIPISADCGFNAFYLTKFRHLENVTITAGTGKGYDCSKTYDRNPWNNAPRLKTLTVEEGVTYIGSKTFYGFCPDTLVLPNSLRSLGECVFGDSYIKYLTIPISLNAVWLDGDAAFEDVSGIRTVTFTPGSGYGQDYAAYKGSNCWYQLTPWYQCRDTLEGIVFEDGIKHIGSDAFRELPITTLAIPNSVESLGGHTFYNCKKLTDLTVPITLDCICSEKYPAFDGCDGYKDSVPWYIILKLRFTVGTDGVGVDYGDLAPFWCTSFLHPAFITFDSGIKYIGTNTLASCTFIGSDGEVLQPTAECLSGHVFTKAADGTYSIDHASVATDDQVSVDCADAGRL